MTPVMLLALLRAWTASGLCQTPSAYVLARQIGSTYKPVSKVLKQLLDLEATAGKDYSESLKLRGYVEVDATSVRCIRVYHCSVRFQSLIQEWIARHPNQRKPPWWLLYFRILGAAQRGDASKMVICPAPLKLVPAGGKPPPEATDEILQSGILTSVARNSTLFADGCKSWSAAARGVSHGGRVLHVSHSKNQFVQRSEDCNRILGTQLLDRNWGHLKTAVPAQAKSRKLDDEGSHPQVYSYVWQALWRKATGHANLLCELGQLARAA
ncbi:unnamed protein product [Symbiodinium sp. CCMP2592]|nr:unnamed protein product [Symbiodinium sp. CCMP2592]